MRRDFARQMAANDRKTGKPVGRLPFLSMLQHVKAFSHAHGRLPSSTSKNPVELALGRWLDQQRKAARSGTLGETSTAYLEDALGTVWDGGQDPGVE